MIRLDSYNIRGFKNINNASVTFNNFNVIIGANNSGKSNFIQSISFLNFIINAPTDDLEKYFRAGFYPTYFGEIIPINHFRTKRNENHLIRFELNFSNTISNRRFEYILELSHHFVNNSNKQEFSYKISSESLNVKENGRPGSPSRVFNRSKDKVVYGIDVPKHGLLESYPEFLSVVRILKIFKFNKEEYLDAVNCLNQILKTPTFYFSHTELSKRESGDRLNILNGRVVAFDLEDEVIKIEQTENWDIFKTAVKNIINIDDVLVARFFREELKKEDKTEQKALFFRHSNFYKNLKEFSDGTILLIALIAKVLTSQNDIFLIEEPENSTHPKALVDLINFMNSFSMSKQFIITSHSIILLNKTKIENIITSCINVDGLSEIFNVANKKELRNRLKSGNNNFSDELFFNNDGTEEFE